MCTFHILIILVSKYHDSTTKWFLKSITMLPRGIVYGVVLVYAHLAIPWLATMISENGHLHVYLMHSSHIMTEANSKNLGPQRCKKFHLEEVEVGQGHSMVLWEKCCHMNMYGS